MEEITITNIDTKEEKVVKVVDFSEEVVLKAVGGGVVIGDAVGMYAIDAESGERLMVCLN